MPSIMHFWRRGYTYYVTGKLMDMHDAPRLWIGYRQLLVDKVCRGDSVDYALAFS